jgi:hypothetical protein
MQPETPTSTPPSRTLNPDITGLITYVAIIVPLAFLILATIILAARS